MLVAGIKTNSSCDIQSASAYDLEDVSRRGSAQTNATLLRMGEATALPVVLCGLLHTERTPSCLYTNMMPTAASLAHSVNMFTTSAASDKSNYQNYSFIWWLVLSTVNTHIKHLYHIVTVPSSRHFLHVMMWQNFFCNCDCPL